MDAQRGIIKSGMLPRFENFSFAYHLVRQQLETK